MFEHNLASTFNSQLDDAKFEQVTGVIMIGDNVVVPYSTVDRPTWGISKKLRLGSPGGSMS